MAITITIKEIGDTARKPTLSVVSVLGYAYAIKDKFLGAVII